MIDGRLPRGARVVGGGRPPRAVNRPAVGLGTDDDFSLLASACRGHLVGVCLHGVSVHAVALAVVVLVLRLFMPIQLCRRVQVTRTARQPGVAAFQARATGAALLRLAALLRRMLAAALLRRMLACLLALTLGVGVGQTTDASPVVGHCGPTSPGECGGSRESGSWHTRRERIRSLEQCAERCRACPSCSFVSYSKVKATSPHLAARTLTSTAWRRNPHPAPP